MAFFFLGKKSGSACGAITIYMLLAGRYCWWPYPCINMVAMNPYLAMIVSRGVIRNMAMIWISTMLNTWVSQVVIADHTRRLELHKHFFSGVWYAPARW